MGNGAAVTLQLLPGPCRGPTLRRGVEFHGKQLVVVRLESARKARPPCEDPCRPLRAPTGRQELVRLKSEVGLTGGEVIGAERDSNAFSLRTRRGYIPA